MPYKDKDKERAAKLAYYYRNKEACRTRKQKWRSENREHLREYERQYKGENPDKRRASKRRYDAKHAEERKNKKRIWYRKNRERLLEKKRKYNEEVRQGIRVPLKIGPRTFQLPVPPPKTYVSPVAPTAHAINEKRQARALVEARLRETLEREYDGKLSPEMIDKFIRELRRLMRGGAAKQDLSDVSDSPRAERPPETSPSRPRLHPGKDESV